MLSRISFAFWNTLDLDRGRMLQRYPHYGLMPLAKGSILGQ
jgi:hypothetical protein